MREGQSLDITSGPDQVADRRYGPDGDVVGRFSWGRNDPIQESLEPGWVNRTHNQVPVRRHQAVRHEPDGVSEERRAESILQRTIVGRLSQDRGRVRRPAGDMET